MKIFIIISYIIIKINHFYFLFCLNLLISDSISFYAFLKTWFLYPKENNISRKTKCGATKESNKLSHKAGALFSKNPCPIN
jgi:hypothetical protein